MRRKNDKMIIETRKISKRSLLKLLLIGIGTTSLVFFTFIGVLAASGAGTVTFNGETYSGIQALSTAFLMWPFFAIAWSLIVWTMLVFGLWIYSKYKPIQIEFNDLEENQRNSSAMGT